MITSHNEVENQSFSFTALLNFDRTETLRWKIGKYVGSNKLYDFRKKIFSNEFKRENDIFIQDFIDYIQNSQFANLGYKTIQLEDGLVAHIKPFDLTQI